MWQHGRSSRHNIQQKKPDTEKVYFVWIYLCEAYWYAKLMYGDRKWRQQLLVEGMAWPEGRFSEVTALLRPDGSIGDVVQTLMKIHPIVYLGCIDFATCNFTKYLKNCIHTNWRKWPAFWRTLRPMSTHRPSCRRREGGPCFPPTDGLSARTASSPAAPRRGLYPVHSPRTQGHLSTNTRRGGVRNSKRAANRWMSGVRDHDCPGMHLPCSPPVSPSPLPSPLWCPCPGVLFPFASIPPPPNAPCPPLAVTCSPCTSLSLFPC